MSPQQRRRRRPAVAAMEGCWPLTLERPELGLRPPLPLGVVGGDKFIKGEISGGRT